MLLVVYVYSRYLQILATGASLFNCTRTYAYNIVLLLIEKGAVQLVPVLLYSF